MENEKHNTNGYSANRAKLACEIAKPLAVPNLHTEVLALIDEIYPQSNTQTYSALDVACGQGHMTCQLYNRGFEIEGVDINPEQFKFNGQIPFSSLDLDTDWSFQKQYDLIVCTEIIEHVKHPIKLLTQLKSILKPDGHIIVSTPNIASIFSRFMFLLTGKLNYFQQNNIGRGNHIMPIYHPTFEFWLSEIGLSIERVSSNRQARSSTTYPVLDTIFNNIVLPIARSGFHPKNKTLQNGEIVIYILRHRSS